MEPLSDEQLDRLLALWVAPSAPLRIETRLLAFKIPWWKRLFGKIRRRGTPRKIARGFRRNKGAI